jgi:predicted alpha-1,2-mannosidase
MKKWKLFPLLLLCLCFGCSPRLTKYIDEVNPLLGTAPISDPEQIGYTPPENWRVWAGLVFPGSSLPNAMVQLSPITKFGTGTGYQYEDKKIVGFAHTSKGHWNLGNISVFPVNGLPAENDISSTFSHENEKASPGYYKVLLDRNDITVQLSSTLRCGIHSYKYSSSDSATVLFDLRKANNRVDQSGIYFVNSNKIKGFQRTEEVTVYFFAEFNNTFAKSYELNGKTWQIISKTKYPDEITPAIALQFDLKDNRELVMKIGLSFVSTEQAEKNLKAEMPDWNFNNIKKDAEKTWESVLSKVQVEGGTSKERMIFYSSLYRSFLWPALRSDVDGQFMDEKGIICKADYNYYSLPSLWDEFRNKLVLISILNPELTGDIIQSMIEMGNKTGYMPTFFHGDHAAPFIAGAYLRGIKNFDISNAYNLLLKNANDPKGPRDFISEYIMKGYISDPDILNPNVETKGKAGVAKTLEYAYDDYSLGLLAGVLGDSVNSKIFSARSQNYKNVFDSSLGFMRGKLDNGNWITPFNPDYPYYEYMFREANAWQQTFFVPHDIPGLIKCFGGKEKFEEKLDSMFTLKWNPLYIARNVDCFIGQYCQGNQPDHHVPFLYSLIGKPEKSQQIIDRIQNMYGIGLDDLALPGMDDTGEMSSWYVFTSIGLYPFSPADPTYLVTVPKFKKTKIEFQNGKYLIIKKHIQYYNSIKSMEINGKEIKSIFIDHKDFYKGGILDIYLD